MHLPLVQSLIPAKLVASDVIVINPGGIQHLAETLDHHRRAGDRTLKIVKRAVFYREKRNTLNLWKTRPSYHELRKKVADKANVAVSTLEIRDLDACCRYLSRRMKLRVLGFKPPFKALSEKRVMLYSEEKKELTGKEIREVSRLVANLETLWEDDPQEFFLLVGKNVRVRKDEIIDRWV